MSARVAVLIYPGTNSEDETLRILRDVGIDAQLVHWSRAETLGSYDAYVLPGGFAYEDRIRAGAIAAHDRLTDAVIEAAQAGKVVLGICNGAQILLEAGLVPGTGAARRPTAAFTKNAPLGKFICRHVYVRLVIAPDRCAITAALQRDVLIPAWAAHGEGRLAATDAHLAEIQSGDHIAFVYARADGIANEAANPNGSALGAAGAHEQSRQCACDHAASGARCVDVQSSNFANRPIRVRQCRGGSRAIGRFAALRELCQGITMSHVRCVAITLKIPDNEAFTALMTLQRLRVPVSQLERADIWLFETEQSDGLLEAVQANELLFNPNKHTLSERAGADPLEGELWVEELGQDPSLRAQLGGKMISGVRSAKRVRGWQLFDENGAPAEQAVVKTAADVLLCNPAIERAILS